MKIKNWIVGLIFTFCALNFIGCATVPTREALPTYNINGTTYLSLVSLCNQKGIALEYDTFTRTAALTKDTHKINLMVGDTLVLVDGQATQIKHPVDIYQGMVVVPYRFKEQILDTLFKERYPSEETIIPLSRIKKIVIDPGHGGNDPGTIGRSGLREKDVNLDIAKRLSSLLKAYGVQVVMTRSTDRYIALSSRVDITNNSKADLFLSLHANANRVRSLNGLEVYYVSTRVDDASRALSAAKNAPLDLDSSSFASNSLNLKATLWDLIYTYNRAEAIELSSAICRTMGRNLDIRILGVKDARFYVLKGARMPAVLIEVGFLSNHNEERLLKNAYYRQQVAEAIFQGVKSYIKERTLAMRK
ncbi:MAG: hypothetical protein A2984_00890 [Omnitrophica WOR_2 bacterium RIFCSPLOWO2_01_FULL_41_12]|nr:MAG: hypothetical protein A2984_00890 [Omnitrophica WOR_2 bacterium RIFCSPLOWO2_01_FULL_41_12]